MADFTNITLPNGEVVPMYSQAAPVDPPPEDEDPGFWSTIAAGLANSSSVPGGAMPGAAGGGAITPVATPQDMPPPKSTAEIRQQAQAVEQAAAPAPQVEGAGLQDLPEPVAQPQRAAPGRLVKGGPQKTDWTVQPGADISGERIDAIEGSYDQRIENREQALADRVLGDEARYIDEAEALNKRRDQLEAQRARRLEIDGEVNRLNEERDKAQKRVEDSTKTDGLKLMGTTAIALISGIGEALSRHYERKIAIAMGQVPPAQPPMSAVKDVFEQHYRELQREYEQAQDSASVADNRYKEALDLYGDLESARKAIEAQDMGITETWLTQQAQQAQDAQQQAAMQDLADQLRQEKEMKLAELEDMTAAKTTERWQQMPDRWVGGGGAGAGKGPKPGSPASDKVVDAQEALDAANAALAYANKLEAEGETTLPGYSVPGSIAKGIATGVAGASGKTAAQAEADKHIVSLASGLKKPGENSDADFDRIKGRVVGNGSVQSLKQSAAQAKRDALRRLEAASGQPAAPETVVPGARR